MASVDRSRQEECLYKTKVVRFLDRTTRIVLQNEYGPCPLLSLCNVLLLKNQLKLSPDDFQVSQENLISLVESLIDHNSNFEDYQILLRQFTTGIHVDPKFTGVRDFEPTFESDIFILLDIPLFHGWIHSSNSHLVNFSVDDETANAIGSKSYNRITRELVSLETQKSRYFDELHRCVPEDGKIIRKGDLEEEETMLRTLRLSEVHCSSNIADSALSIAKENILTVNQAEVKTLPISPLRSVDPGMLVTPDAAQNVSDPHASAPNACENQTDKRQECYILETYCSNDAERVAHADRLKAYTADNEINNESGRGSTCEKTGVHDKNAILLQVDTKTLPGLESGLTSFVSNNLLVSDSSNNLPTNSTSTLNITAGALVCEEVDVENSSLIIENIESDKSPNVDEVKESVDEEEEFEQDSDHIEFMYEEEEFKQDLYNCDSIHEGEAVLLDQTDHGSCSGTSTFSKDELTPIQGDLVDKFLKTNASQLTIYGLFCLQEGLKECELGVFFCNNHFKTMFKFECQLYILVSDQGYLSQTDLVWEKLNEVNGHSVFMTSNFEEFKSDRASASTSDFIASVNNSADTVLNFNSDFQYATVLQQQEYDQQPQLHPLTQVQAQPQSQSQPHSPHQPQTPIIASSQLVTGPQARRNGEGSSSSSSAWQEAKSNKKCSIM